MENKIIIIGANEYSKVVYDAIISQGIYAVVGFADDSLALGTSVIGDSRVVATLERSKEVKHLADYFIVAVEDNNDRKHFFEEIKQYLSPATIVHPTSVVGSTVILGEGSVVLANAEVFSSVGVNTIVKQGVVIDHSCVIGNHVLLGVGTSLRSGHTVEDRYTTVARATQLLIPNAVNFSGKIGGLSFLIAIFFIILLLVVISFTMA